jgi:hypothetical protein
MKELRTAIRAKKPIIIIRNYLYKIPEPFPESVADVEQVLKSSLTLEWMAGNYSLQFSALY